VALALAVILAEPTVAAELAEDELVASTLAVELDAAAAASAEKADVKTAVP
jgi:hypothetical protein